MPCTTTQNTIGATIIEISFRNASLKILSPTAKSGAAIPSTMPSSEGREHLDEQRGVERLAYFRGSGGDGRHGRLPNWFGCCQSNLRAKMSQRASISGSLIDAAVTPPSPALFLASCSCCAAEGPRRVRSPTACAPRNEVVGGLPMIIIMMGAIIWLRSSCTVRSAAARCAICLIEICFHHHTLLHTLGTCSRIVGKLTTRYRAEHREGNL